jgi:hypothetical protein
MSAIKNLTNTLKEHIIQAPLELYYTSVQMNVPKTILTKTPEYEMKKKRNSYITNLFYTGKRFILGRPSNKIRKWVTVVAASTVMAEAEVMVVVREEASIEVLLVQNQLKWVRNMMWTSQKSVGKETVLLESKGL